MIRTWERREEREHTKADIPEDCNPPRDISSIKSVVEARHRISAGIGDFLHLLELVCASSGQIEEGEFVEVLRLLICLLDNFMVPLFQCLLGKSFPAFRAIDCPCGLHRHIKVATLNGEFEACIGILDEVKSNLGR